MVSDFEFRGIDHIHTYVGDILDEGEEVYPRPGMQSGATFRRAKLNLNGSGGRLKLTWEWVADL